MKGHKKIISALNQMLTYELTSINQYFLHSEMYLDWGLHELYERIHHEMEDEKGHATDLMQRILFLEGHPGVENLNPMKIGKTVPEMLQSDLKLELEGRKLLQETIALCESLADYQTREILEKLLSDTEVDHIYWLEQQLSLIEKIGLENYLQKKMKNPAQ